MCTKLVAYVYQTSGLWVTTQQQVLTLNRQESPALRITTVQTRRAPVHDDEGLGAALVAEGRRGWEAGAIAGDGDVFSGTGRRSRAHFTVFF